MAFPVDRYFELPKTGLGPFSETSPPPVELKHAVLGRAALIILQPSVECRRRDVQSPRDFLDLKVANMLKIA